MKTNDSIFAREFKAMMDGRRSLTSGFKLSVLPLPVIDTMLQGVPKGRMALIRGIKELFFDRLNNQDVQLVGRTSLQKRQVLSDGTFRLDNNGQFVYDQIPVSHNCIAILSPISIGIRRFVDGQEHRPSDGFRYVDYIESPNNSRRYIYIVPKQFVYRLELCALIITSNKRRVFYKGCRLALQNGNYVYLYVIPYKYRANMDARVLGVKSSFNFDKEVTAILNYWAETGVIFFPCLTALTDNISGVSNLGIVDLEGTVASDDYRRFDISLADEKEQEYQDIYQ